PAGGCGSPCIARTGRTARERPDVGTALRAPRRDPAHSRFQCAPTLTRGRLGVDAARAHAWKGADRLDLRPTRPQPAPPRSVLPRAGRPPTEDRRANLAVRARGRTSPGRPAQPGRSGARLRLLRPGTSEPGLPRVCRDPAGHVCATTRPGRRRRSVVTFVH